MTTPGIVIVGAGHLGTYHLNKIKELESIGEARLVAVVDVDGAASGARAMRQTATCRRDAAFLGPSLAATRTTGVGTSTPPAI